MYILNYFLDCGAEQSLFSSHKPCLGTMLYSPAELVGGKELLPCVYGVVATIIAVPPSNN